MKSNAITKKEKNQNRFSLIKKTMIATHGPIAISIYNAVIFYILISSVVSCISILMNGYEINSHEIDIATSGISTILIGYGVALESRDDLMKFYGVYPEYHCEFENRVDEICHGYGLIFLVLGLVVEIAKEAITAPNNIINTDGADWTITLIATIFLIISGFLIVGHTAKLGKLRFSFRSESSEVAQ